MTVPLLQVEDLRVALPGGGARKWAVDGLNLTVGAGEILCIVGESGSGKSVLASQIMGALPPGLTRKEGRIRFDGLELTSLAEKQLRRIRGRDIAMIFQEPMASLNPSTRVGNQVAEVLKIHAPQITAKERRDRCLALLAETHLKDVEALAKRYPHQLSGGQCQRVVIAMAMALAPRLLIADEPTTALDVTTQAQILRLIAELRDKHNNGIIFITHDFGVVAEIADRVAVMRAGRLVEIGCRKDILQTPRSEYTKALLAAVPSLNPPPRPKASNPPAIALDRLAKSYGPAKVLREISFEVPRSSIVAIVGESGSGKSTLAKIALRLVTPTAGSVLVAGEDISRLGRDGVRKYRKKVQIVFQDPYGSLNPYRSIGDILRRACVLGGSDRDAAKRRASELLDLVGLERDALTRKPDAFSGGQRQRICIARALALNPEILVADESVSALDVSIQEQILDLLKDLQAKTGLTVLFITHDLRVAAQIADLIAVMHNGRLVEFGAAGEVLRNPKDRYTAQLLAAVPGKEWTENRDRPSPGMLSSTTTDSRPGGGATAVLAPGAG